MNCVIHQDNINHILLYNVLREAEGLGITEPINSPTFTIVQVYEEGRLPFRDLIPSMTGR